ncbi:MAG: HlyD family efflux transporter periplasmic adaptor subunit [Cyanobacteria bacterium P01_C01_bin.120]
MNSKVLVQTATSARPMRRWVIAGVAIAGVLGIGVWQVGQMRQVRLQEAAQQAAAQVEITTVTALGRLEPQGEMIQLTAPTSTQESRIDQLLVRAGDRVQAGDVIAILDNRDRLQAALQRAEERVRVAAAELARVQAGAQTGELQAQRDEIARLEAERVGRLNTQRATVARLEAELQNARTEFDRYSTLYQRGAVSASERDTRELSYTTAQRQFQEAQAELARIDTASQQEVSRARATLEQIAEVRPVDVQVAEAEFQAAQAEVAEAQANLDQATVRSPVAGQVIKIHTRPGEIIASDGIATLGQTDQMMAIAEVYQSDIAKIQVGQSATITSSAVPETLTGTVERIGLQVEPQQVVDEDPAANVDARVVEVHVRLDEASSGQVAGLANLQVTVTVQAE